MPTSPTSPFHAWLTAHAGALWLALAALLVLALAAWLVTFLRGARQPKRRIRSETSMEVAQVREGIARIEEKLAAKEQPAPELHPATVAFLAGVEKQIDDDQRLLDSRRAEVKKYRHAIWGEPVQAIEETPLPPAAPPTSTATATAAPAGPPAPAALPTDAPIPAADGTSMATAPVVPVAEPLPPSPEG